MLMPPAAESAEQQQTLIDSKECCLKHHPSCRAVTNTPNATVSTHPYINAPTTAHPSNTRRHTGMRTNRSICLLTYRQQVRLRFV
jgi:homoserine acetyltransferase